MTQFKVGDKVRIIGKGAAGVKIGTLATVTGADAFGVYLDVKNIYGGTAFYYSHNLELVSDKPTKKQRLSDAEKRIAELEAKVDALELKSSEINVLQAQVAELEKAQKPTINIQGGVFKTPSDADVAKVAEQLSESLREATKGFVGKPSPNEQRKAIIAEAKAFVEDALLAVVDGHGDYRLPNGNYVQFETIVNAEKRTVVVLAKSWFSGKVRFKYTAKCAPDDVFNADIGKAIALGRALGLDVERFEQAVKPAEVVVGHVVGTMFDSDTYAIKRVDDVKAYTRLDGPLHFRLNQIDGERAFITEDTDAQY